MTILYRGTELADKIKAQTVFPFDELVEIHGFGGNDELIGAFLHQNFIDGGSGDDSISGGAKNSQLFGGLGNDTLDNWIGDASSLYGGAGRDKLIAGDDGDHLDGGAGADTLHGGDGADTYVVDSVQDLIVETFLPYFDNDPNPLDTVLSSVSWSLAFGLEDLELLGGRSLHTSNDSPCPVRRRSMGPVTLRRMS